MRAGDLWTDLLSLIGQFLVNGVSNEMTTMKFTFNAVNTLHYLGVQIFPVLMKDHHALLY